MANEITNWFNGLPSEGVEISANSSGSITYWFNGLPSEQIFSATGGGTVEAGGTVESYPFKFMLMGVQ